MIGSSGLIIDNELSFLIVFPDGLINEDSLGDIKYPIMSKGISLEDVISK